MRERGAGARRREDDGPEPWRVPQRPGGLSPRLWPAVAIVAIIVATAGWTTVAVMSLNQGQANLPVATVGPTDGATDSPAPPSHEFPDLEATLPATVTGVAMDVESWSGDEILGDDPLSQALDTFLTNHSKTATDLRFAQSFDSSGTLDVSAAAYQVPGVDGAALRDAIISGVKVLYPNVVISQATFGGKTVIKGVFGNQLANSYWYAAGDVAFDVEASDETQAIAALAALSPPGVPPASPSGSPSGSPSPSPS
ncbi:MAG: hypothetical protein ACHQ15_07930 [Candidatus Limnocylindrales bacterium]